MPKWLIEIGSYAQAAWTWLLDDGDLLKFFQDELRSEFFNGFLSLAGFMLAAKTFIVIHMKHEVYDTKEYQKSFDERRRQTGESAATRYGPLERMSKALLWITVSSLIAAVCQVTIGLLPCNLAVLICLATVLFAGFKLFFGLHLMRINLDRWFTLIHKEEADREQANKGGKEEQEQK